jgi:predicted ester cyclase
MANDPISVVKRWHEINESGDLDSLPEVISDKLISRNLFPGVPGELSGFKLLEQGKRASFPDAKIEIEQIFSEGNMVAMVTRMRATHEGDFVGIPATGKKVDFLQAHMFLVDDGKIVEHWGVNDIGTTFEQLGVQPPA